MWCPVYGNRCRGCPACNPIEHAPLRKEFNRGGVFQGAGNSHFTAENGRFHVTTEVPGLKQGVRIPIRDDIEE